jgi:hypothetical protein
VDDHVARIDQNPVALWKTLDTRCPVARLL